MVTVTTVLGDLTSAQMRVLGQLALAFADGTVRITSDQNVVLRWVPEAALSALYSRLAAAGLSRAGASTLADVTSCPGAESCKLAVTQSRGLGRLLSDSLRRRGPIWSRPCPASTSRSAAVRTGAVSITSPASASRAACARSADGRRRTTS